MHSLGKNTDLVIGIITAAEEKYFRQLKDTTLAFGEIAAPDDCYQALKGMKSMGARRGAFNLG